MRYILIFSIFTFINFYCIGQDFPKYYIINKDTIGITLSLNQVKRIKRDLELKSILEKMKISCDSISKKSSDQERVCDDKLKAKDQVIYSLDTSVMSKKYIIRSLNSELVTTRFDRDICKMASSKKDSLNTTINLRLAEVKTQRNFWFGTTIFFLVSSFGLLFFH